MHNNRLLTITCRLMTMAAMVVVLLTGCRKEDDTIVYKKARVVEKTVAVVAPLSNPIMKTRLERIADWMQTNLEEAQMGDSLRIKLKLEWYDEETQDIRALGSKLAEREDVATIIGPFDNDRLALMATACQRVRKPLIAPTATSESVIRQFAVSTSGDNQGSPFLWALTETDVSLSEISLATYATFYEANDLPGIDVVASKALLITPDNSYGRTFQEWLPFQAGEMGINLRNIATYNSDEDMLEQLWEYYKVNIWSLMTPQVIVTSSVDAFYQVTRIRSMALWMDPDDPSYDDTIEGIGRAQIAPPFFVLSNLTNEAIAAMGPRAIGLSEGYMGFSPFADPSTGFEISYNLRYDTNLTFAECKFYDALLLTAFATDYMEHRPGMTDVNQAIIDITTTDNIISDAAWDRMGMQVYLNAIESGELYGFTGASGEIRFDSECYTSSLNTTYVNWVMHDGKVYSLNYFSRKGSTHTSETLASWKWHVQNAEKSFDKDYSGSIKTITYPALTDQYALLVQGSTGWNNYRHEADVLNVYQLLRDNGFDDDHIILITADYAANAPENTIDRGAVRTETNGRNLYEGVRIDYQNTNLVAADVINILKGVATEKTPVVIPPGEGNNLLVFWSGHGHEMGFNGVNELAWVDNMAGNGVTDDMLRFAIEEMAQKKQFRQMLICLEPCYSENMGKAVEGIPGVLAISAARAKEQSFADYRSEALGVWMCDRFSRNLVNCARSNPSATYRDFYLYCAQNTLGSHVSIHNYHNFGNLYTNSPHDFFYYSK